MGPSRSVSALRNRWFSATPNDWQTYHQLILQTVKEGMVVCDVGCGKGLITPLPVRQFPKVNLLGIDPDPSSASNPLLSEFRLLDNFDRWPLETASCDLVVARYVLEHVENPESFFANLRRVLRPNGRFIFLTPNYRHLAVVVSGLLPLGVKRAILGATQRLPEDDVFGTHYRLNTPEDVRSFSDRYDFAVETLEVREYVPSGYGDFFLPMFLAFAGYRLAVRASGLESRFGQSMVGVLRRLERGSS